MDDNVLSIFCISSNQLISLILSRNFENKGNAITSPGLLLFNVSTIYNIFFSVVVKNNISPITLVFNILIVVSMPFNSASS